MGSAMVRRLSYLMPIAGGFVAATIVFQASPSWAQRAADYTPRQFVSVLNGLGYPVKLEDPIDAANVKQAIRDFQVQYNLPVNGSPTPQSQDMAAAIVRSLQQSINQTLRPPQLLPENQFYGAQTEILIKQFQTQNQLPVTGIATLETRQRLAAALSVGGGGRGNDDRSIGIPPAIPQTVPPAIPQTIPQLPANIPPSANVRFGNLYTEPEFHRVLQGLGYDIAPQKFLSDAPATIALRDFQSRYDLATTGVADQPTQEKAKMILRVLQYNLRVTVNKNLLTTEFYDAQTAAAVEQFQRQNSLQIDGIATVSVRQRINDAAQQRLRRP